MAEIDNKGEIVPNAPVGSILSSPDLSINGIMKAYLISPGDLITMLIISGVMRSYGNAILLMGDIPIAKVVDTLRDEMDKFLNKLDEIGIEGMRELVCEHNLNNAGKSPQRTPGEVFMEMRAVVRGSSVGGLNAKTLGLPPVDFE